MLIDQFGRELEPGRLQARRMRKMRVLARERITIAQRLVSTALVEKRLGRALFRGVCTDHFGVPLPRLLGALGDPGELLPGSLLRSPGLQHLRVTQWNLRLIRG